MKAAQLKKNGSEERKRNLGQSIEILYIYSDGLFTRAIRLVNKNGFPITTYQTRSNAVVSGVKTKPATGSSFNLPAASFNENCMTTFHKKMIWPSVAVLTHC